MVRVEEMDPLLVLGVILVAGAAGGYLAQRAHLPRVTGNIVAGVLLSVTLFHGTNVAQLLHPISTFAIGLIAVTAGGHLAYRRLHNSMGRVVHIGVGEVAVCFGLIFASLWWFPLDWPFAEIWPAVLILSCFVDTSPATTFALIREHHAKGPFVKTLLAVVAVDSSLCIILFSIAHSLLASYYVHGAMEIGMGPGLLQAGRTFAGSALLGIVIGIATTPLFASHRYNHFSVLLVAVLFATGGAYLLEFSGLLTCLFLGGYLGNSTRENERHLNALEPAAPFLYTAFFTLAGAGVHLELLAVAGLPCLVYVVARGMGKGVGAWLGAKMSGATARITRSIPFGFVPQAGVALGLAVVFAGDARIPEEVSSFVSTLVLAAVTINEIVGPLVTRYALRRSQEVGLDRPRLVDFLDEEHIALEFAAKDRWDAIEKLTDFYCKTHHVRPSERESILRSVKERETRHSTAIGHGAALPHGHVDHGSAIEGVLAISPEGVDFEAPDGNPAHIMVLIVTPHDHEERHLQVLASVSAMVSNDVSRSRLMAASNANEVWEVLESGEARNYNYFLDIEEEGNGIPSSAPLQEGS